MTLLGCHGGAKGRWVNFYLPKKRSLIFATNFTLLDVCVLVEKQITAVVAERLEKESSENCTKAKKA